MSNLPTSALGRTGLAVTRLGYGTALGEGISESRWRDLLNAVLDAGINFIDTANDYGISFAVPSEEMVGRLISPRRHEYFIATKCGCAPKGGPHVWTRENAFRGLHESLRRLRTDYVDVMQYHNPTVDEAEEGDLVAVLQDMKKEGKVRWLGVSTELPNLPTFLEWGVFDVFQVPYSAFERDHEGWITRSAQEGVGIIVRGGVAQGEPGESETDESRARQWRKFEEAGLDELRQGGESRTGFILRYTLTHPNIDTNIVGTTNTEHLAENIRNIIAGPLPDDVYAEAKRRLDGVGLTAPQVP